MRRTLFAGLFALSGLTLLASSVPARALVAIPGPVNPGPARAAQSDAVVVGRVVALEDKDIQIQKVTYRIAVVQVTDALKGTKEQMVKVGFIPVPNPGINPNPRLRPVPVPFPGRFGGPQFTVGQDGLFFLNKGPEGKFFTAPHYFSFVPGQAGNFKQEVDQAKLAVKIGDNPKAALKAENADERVFAAAILIQKYRERRLDAKLEPIDAAESKLILKALAAANWNAPLGGQMHPYYLFNQLGVTVQDGFKLPPNIRDFKERLKATQEWLDKNADKYVIKKFVGGKPFPQPGIRPLPIEIQPPIRIQPIPGKIQIQPVPPPQALPVQPPGQIRVLPIRIQPVPLPQPVPVPPQIQPGQVVPKPVPLPPAQRPVEID